MMMPAVVVATEVEWIGETMSRWTEWLDSPQDLAEQCWIPIHKQHGIRKGKVSRA